MWHLFIYDASFKYDLTDERIVNIIPSNNLSLIELPIRFTIFHIKALLEHG